MTYYYGFDRLGGYHGFNVGHAKLGELEAITELHGYGQASAALFAGVASEFGQLDGEMLGSFWSQLATAETENGREIKVKDKLKYIGKLILDGSKHPEVMLKAREIVQGVGDKDTTKEIKAVWHWLKRNIRYVMDPLGQEVIGKAYRYVTPNVKKRVKAGDCDEFAVVGGALLQSIGHPVRMVLWKRNGGDWQHIFLVAYSKKDRAWLVVDPTEKDKPFGWHPATGEFKIIALPGEQGNLGPTELGSWLSSAFKKVKKVATKAWEGVKKVASKVADGVKAVLPSVAGALASAIPGVGPILAPMASQIVNGLVNNGKANPAMEQMNQAIASGKSGSELLATVASQGISAVTGPVLERVQQMVPQITQIADQFMPMIQQFLPQGVTNTINDARQWMQRLPAQMQQGVQQFSDHVQQSIAVPATAQILYNQPQVRQATGATSAEQMLPYAHEAMYAPGYQRQAYQHASPEQRAQQFQQFRDNTMQSTFAQPGRSMGPTGPSGVATPTAADYQALERGRQFAAQQEAQRQANLRQYYPGGESQQSMQPQQQQMMIPAQQPGFDQNFDPMQFNPQMSFYPRGESQQAMQQQAFSQQQPGGGGFSDSRYPVNYPQPSQQQQLQQQRMAPSQGGVNQFALDQMRRQVMQSGQQQQFQPQWSR